MPNTTEKQMRFPLFEIQLAEKDGKVSVPSKVQLCKMGEYYDLFGKFVVDERMFMEFVRNFDAKVYGQDLAIDYGHDSGGPAAGWIRKLSVEDGGLFGEIDWTAPGRECVAGKVYRYFSIDFTTDFVHNETQVHYGPLLKGAALTNRPFVKNMAPAVELSEFKGDHSMAMTAEEKTTFETALSESKQLSEKVTALETENATLKQTLAEKEENEKVAAKKAAFDKLLTEGKAVEAQRDSWMSGDVAKFAELAKPLNTESKGSGEAGEGAVKSATEEVIEKAEILLSEKVEKDLPSAISAVLRGDS